MGDESEDDALDILEHEAGSESLDFEALDARSIEELRAMRQEADEWLRFHCLPNVARANDDAKAVKQAMARGDDATNVVGAAGTVGGGGLALVGLMVVKGIAAAVISIGGGVVTVGCGGAWFAWRWRKKRKLEPRLAQARKDRKAFILEARAVRRLRDAIDTRLRAMRALPMGPAAPLSGDDE